MPSVQGLPGDRWVLGAGVSVVVALLAIGWMVFATAGQAEELEVQIESAVRDSARLADVIERSERLRSQGDSIARRVDVIQQIDGSRYVWPHIMDEVARALPDYTWLTRIQQVTSGEPMAFRIEGRAGTYFALTSFMEAVEASPFIRRTQLISSDQVFMSVGGGAQRLVYDFALEAEYRDPPPDLIQSEPLFGGSVLAPGSEEN
jgi:Tfp pilus assembly protein PilN